VQLGAETGKYTNYYIKGKDLSLLWAVLNITKIRKPCLNILLKGPQIKFAVRQCLVKKPTGFQGGGM
jgi:hypothetical protein